MSQPSKEMVAKIFFHTKNISERSWHLQLWQVSPRRGRACWRAVRLGQGVLNIHQWGKYIPVISYTTTTLCALSASRGHTVCREGAWILTLRCKWTEFSDTSSNRREGMLLRGMFPGKKISVSRVTVSVSEELTSAAASIYPPCIGQSSQIQALR